VADLNFSVNANISDAAAQFNKLWQEYINGSRAAGLEANKLLGGDVVKKLQVRIETDGATGVRTVNAYLNESLTAIDKISQAYKRANEIQRGSVTSLRQQVNEAKQARDQVEKYGASAQGLFGKVRQIAPEWADQNARVKALTRELELASASGFWERLKAATNLRGFLSIGNSITELVTTFQSLGIVIQQIQAPVRALESSLAGLQSFQLSFKAIGVSAEGSNLALRESARISLGLGASLKTVRDGLQRLSPVILQSGGTIRDVSDITEALASRFAAFGLSADASRRVMNGVIQAFAKGKLQAEELTQQISEADPAFKVDLANALKVTIQQLEAMVKAGQVTTDVLIEILPQIGKSDLLFGKLGSSATSAVNALRSGNVTIEQVRTQLQNIGQISLENLARVAEPLIASFLQAQAAITDFLSSLSKLEGIKSLISIFGSLGQSAANVLGVVLRLAEGFLVAVSPFLQLVNAIVSSAPGIALITTALGVKLVNVLSGFVVSIRKVVSELISVSSGNAVAAKSYDALGTSALSAAAKLEAAAARIKAAKQAAQTQQLSLGIVLPPKPESITGQMQQLELFDTLGDKAQNASQKVAQSGNFISNIGQKIGASLQRSGQQISGVFGGIASAVSAPKLAIANFVDASLSKAEQFGNGVGGKISSGVGSAVSSIKGLVAAFGLEIAAAAAVSLAIDAYAQSTQRADNINKSFKTSTNEVNQALIALGKGAVQTGDGWQASVDNVGALQAGLDRLRRGIGLTTAEQTQYDRATVASAEGGEKLLQSIDKLGAEYVTLRDSGNRNGESLERQNKAYGAIESTINSNIQSLEAMIAKEEGLAVVSGEVDEAKKRNIQVMKNLVDSLKSSAAQYGITTTKMKDQASAANALAEEIKKIAQVQIDNLNKQKDQFKQGYDEELQRIEDTKTAAREKYDEAKQRLSDQKRTIKETYDAQKEAIRSVRDAESERANAAIRQLQALTPAERELQKLRIRDLQEQTGRGGQEGLEARAQLERIQANEQIARIQEEERQKEEAAKKEIARIEKEEKEAIKKIDEEERQKEKEHKEEMRKLDKESAELKKEQKEKEIEIDKQIAEYNEQIKTSSEDAAKAAGEFTGHLEDGATAAEEIRKRMQTVADIASKIRIPSVNGSRFAGGSVTGGGRYTVNEFGQEMFLSSAGRLSYIKAPAWGSWTAPSGGTVIPAHIAAGIDIPRSGMQLSRQASGMPRTMPNTANGTNKLLASLVGAVRASMTPRSDSGLAVAVASQAVQLGKLTHVVNDLVDKDWNVQVNVRSTGDSIGYMRAVNRRI
jgi:tape measure domain-containing protein